MSWPTVLVARVSEQPPYPLWASVLISGVPLSLTLLQAFKSSTLALDPGCWEGGKPSLSHGHPLQLQMRSEAQRGWGVSPLTHSPSGQSRAGAGFWGGQPLPFPL